MLVATKVKVSILSLAQLAREKAAAISATNEDVYVIGADQMLDCDGQWFDKPPDLEAAAQSLIRLRAGQHDLVTSASIVRNGKEVWRLTDRATLHMRDFSDRFLEQYLSDVGELALTSVGAYQLEGHGAQLFERIEGDYFTIPGLPLLPLLSYLREQELIPRELIRKSRVCRCHGVAHLALTLALIAWVLAA